MLPLPWRERKQFSDIIDTKICGPKWNNNIQFLFTNKLISHHELIANLNGIPAEKVSTGTPFRDVPFSLFTGLICCT